jgi:glycosyltransferase involved in cell wall biosynthesis
MRRPTVSLITTVYNEEATIGAFLESLLAQTREPDEIIICDAGSRDTTRAVIARHRRLGLRAQLIVEEGANRAQGRNAAIRKASGEIIASIDAGCTAHRDWLARLTAPFDSDDPPDVVAGYYEPDTRTPLEDAIAVATVPDPSEVDPAAFLPSGRSVAFRRAAWEHVGGYPEYTEYAEDTAFDLQLRQAGYRFLFIPNARVSWRTQTSFFAVFRQFFRYARSDGELRHWFGHYRKACCGVFSAVLLLFLAAAGDTPGFWGFLFALLTVLYWGRYTARARARGADWHPALLAPAVSLTVDLANFLGYLLGFLRSRPRPRPLPVHRPLSIAQITYTYKPIAGGADVYASQLADLITSAGHDHCVYQRMADSPAEDVRAVPNPWRGLPFEFWTHALALFRLRKQILSHDLVICHYPHYLLAVDLMSLFGPRPIRVALSHGVFWDDSAGSPRSFIKASLARLAFRRAHLYVANDTHFLRAMGLRIAPKQRMHSQVAPRVWFIPNAPDTHKFRPTEPIAEIADRTAILVPRNLFRNRGIHLAIEAFAQFYSSHLNSSLFIVGGGGQPRYIASLGRLVARHNLEGSVVFYGSVAHDRLPAVYSSAEFTLIPSLCGEGTSLSALESMACGTATICTHVAGLKDLPGPHAAPTPLSLAKIMHRVHAEAKRVGEDQRKAVLAEYSPELWQRAWAEALLP